MSASTERRTRKLSHGGVVDGIPEGATVKGYFKLDGQHFAELTDGRIAKVPAPVSAWAIRDGKIVQNVPVGLRG